MGVGRSSASSARAASTTTIFNGRFPRDVYAYACDSLPLMLFGLRAAGAEHLVERHRELLGARGRAYFHDVVFDPELGMARPTAISRGRATA